MESGVNVFQFQGNNMIVHAKGPHMFKNMSGLHTNLMSSTMNMPRNFEEHSYPESTRSLYYGRASSPPMSVRSDFQPQNFHQPLYQGYSQRSTYGRGGSPVSMRSMGSCSSMDIIRLIENADYSEQEWRAIQLAFKRKHQYSRMVERRRRIKKQYEHRRKQDNDDSGEQGSNSSISSDESIRTGYSRYNRRKENIPYSIADYRKRDRDNRNNQDDNFCGDYADANTQNPYRSNTDSHHVQNMGSFQSNTLQKYNNMAFLQPGSENRFFPQKNITSGNILPPRFVINGHENSSSLQKNALNSSICSMKSLQNQTVMSQRERFQRGFQFPSQRFNNSVMQFQQQNQSRAVNIKRGNQNTSKQISCLNENSDENDDIFPNTTEKPVIKVTNNLSKKRNIDSLDSIPETSSKKRKSSNKIETRKETLTKNNKKEFVFAKPTFPVKKSAPAKPPEKEKLISKSAPVKPPEKEKLISKSAQFGELTVVEQEKNNQPFPVAEPANQEKEMCVEPANSTQLTISDTSMRPSFMKRKLFTQTLDVTVQKNNSCENSGIDSPQSNIYSELSREKHRTRKLVTSQSLLSRDVNQDDNNLLDLIHKIVPLSQVNTSKQPKLSVDKTAGDDKFDVTSIISTCNNDSVSDTYTDEEIFNVTNNVKNNKSKEKPNNKPKNGKMIEDAIKPPNDKPKTRTVHKVTKKCNVVVEKLPLLQGTSEPPAVAVEACAVKKPSLSNSRLDAFWNTDVESDFECGTPARHKIIQGPPKLISTSKQNTSTNDVKSTPTTRKSKNVIGNPKTLVINKSDCPLVKTLKKQTNKQSLTTNNAKENISRRDKSDKKKKATPVKVTKTKRQERNNTSVLKSTEKTRSPKKPTPEVIKKTANGKPTVKKAIKTRSSSDNNKQNDSLLSNKRKIEHNNQRRRPSKAKNVQDDSDMLHKVLRTRTIDLSSSFNSDQFELTGISSVRKSRTPVKATFRKKTKK